MTDAVQHFATAAVAEIVADRAAVPLRSDVDGRLALFEAVAGEMRPLVFQVAEMAAERPDQLLAAAEYLHGRLEREPLRSSPAWEAHRVVLGLFQLCLVNAAGRADTVSAEDRAALRPAYMRDAAATVTTAFDSTYIPPADEQPDPEPPEDPLPTVSAPEPADADLLAQL